MTVGIAGIKAPDSELAQQITELVRDTESPLLFHHSSRVFYWGALTGLRRGLTFDAELLYAGAMFHDMGLTPHPATPPPMSVSKWTARTSRARSCATMAFGNVKADVLADKDPLFMRTNFCSVIRGSAWRG